MAVSLGWGGPRPRSVGILQAEHAAVVSLIGRTNQLATVAGGDGLSSRPLTAAGTTSLWSWLGVPAS